MASVGYLALGKKLDSTAAPPASPPVAVSTPTGSTPQPVAKTAGVGVARADGKGRSPLLGASATAEIRRKCVEADDDGKGRAKVVAAACRAALEAESQDVDVMAILARAEIDRGRLAEAKALAKKMLAADPKRFDAYVFLGTAEQEAGKTDEAREAYKKYLELAPNGPFARELRAVLNNL
jgi:tetratricopeptide (TPR) repeat protein